MNLETKLQKAIIDALRLRFREDELIIARINSGRVRARGGQFRGAPAGWADLIGCVRLRLALQAYDSESHERGELVFAAGRFLALEVKIPGEQPNDDQRAFMASVRAMGGYAAVVTSVDEAINAVLEAQKG